MRRWRANDVRVSSERRWRSATNARGEWGGGGACATPRTRRHSFKSFFSVSGAFGSTGSPTMPVVVLYPALEVNENAFPPARPHHEPCAWDGKVACVAAPTTLPIPSAPARTPKLGHASLAILSRWPARAARASAILPSVPSAHLTEEVGLVHVMSRSSSPPPLPEKASPFKCKWNLRGEGAGCAANVQTRKRRGLANVGVKAG